MNAELGGIGIITVIVPMPIPLIEQESFAHPNTSSGLMAQVTAFEVDVGKNHVNDFVHMIYRNNIE